MSIINRINDFIFRSDKSRWTPWRWPRGKPYTIMYRKCVDGRIQRRSYMGEFRSSSHKMDAEADREYHNGRYWED